MSRFFHNLLLALVLMATVLACGAPSVALAGDFDDQVTAWERLDYERSALVQRLKNLEGDHQESVDTIEKLKQRLEQGEGSRSDLEDELRRNLSIIQDLEQLQRELGKLDERQSALRDELLSAIDDRRHKLEQSLRDASDSDERAEIVEQLNDLQTQRQQFRIPLPEADQQRLEQILADTRAVSDGHPRAMLSAADELEDTREQLEARLNALDERIRELEQSRQLARHSRQFGQFDRFFDESDRSRTIADYERTVEGDQDVAQANEDHGPEEFDPAHENTNEDIQDEPLADAEPSAGEDSPEEAPESEPPAPQTETIVIESETDPEQAETTYFDDQAMERDLRRLQRERDGLEDQAQRLERKAEQLRREAEQSY